MYIMHIYIYIFFQSVLHCKFSVMSKLGIVNKRKVIMKKKSPAVMVAYSFYSMFWNITCIDNDLLQLLFRWNHLRNGKQNKTRFIRVLNQTIKRDQTANLQINSSTNLVIALTLRLLSIQVRKYRVPLLRQICRSHIEITFYFVWNKHSRDLIWP